MKIWTVKAENIERAAQGETIMDALVWAIELGLELEDIQGIRYSHTLESQESQMIGEALGSSQISEVEVTQSPVGPLFIGFKHTTKEN